MLGLLLFAVVMCFLLWVVNASGWVDLPPPLKMGITLILIIVLILGVLQGGGIYRFRDL